MLHEMSERLKLLDERLQQYDRRVERIFGQDERCQRLAQVEASARSVLPHLLRQWGMRTSSKAVASSALG
jgi:hypothetical protein